MGNPANSEENMGTRQDQIALKYLDLARVEIQDRMSSSNKTLILYVGGVGGIVAWMYQVTLAATHPLSLRTLVFCAGVVISFLSFAASWIIFHNERMVNALARYQTLVLAPYLDSVLPSVKGWESSTQLSKTDTGMRTYWAVAVPTVILIGPSIIFMVGMFYDNAHLVWPATCAQWACFAGTLTLAVVAFYFSFDTVVDRNKLRREESERRARAEAKAAAHAAAANDEIS